MVILRIGDYDLKVLACPICPVDVVFDGAKICPMCYLRGECQNRRTDVESASPCKKCFQAQHVWTKKDGVTKYTVRCKELGCDLEMVGEIPIQAKGCPKADAESGQKG